MTDQKTNDNLVLSFIKKYNPYILIALPCIVAEFVGGVTAFAGGSLISKYLLQFPDDAMSLSVSIKIVLLFLEILYMGATLIFLWPVFSAHHKKDSATAYSMLRARNRVYNFPAFLIISVWSVNILEHSIFYFIKPETIPTGPFLVTGLIATVVSAIVVYYSSDFLNRFVLIPHYFPDGKIEVSRKIRVPSLLLRFGDTFFVSGVLPVLSIAGIILLAIEYGKHDADELQRLFFASLCVGIIFWIFGGILTYLSSITFLGPLQSMEDAFKEFGTGNFNARVPVHSDDQIGIMEQAVNRMGAELREKEIIKTVFGHYVSPAVRDLILGGKVRTEGDKIEAVILFSDIRSFTALSENHPPERIVKLLNIHFSRIVDIVSRNDGFVDKFIGDAVMAVFDEELTGGNHRISALRSAADILSELESTNIDIANLGFSPIKIGIGIAAGPVIRGNIGSENRREMTVIGDTVNLASRLESATKEYGSPILVTKESFDRDCENFSLIRTVSEKSLTIRGKSEKVKVLALDLAP